MQLSWYTLSAPLTGRVGTFAAKAGNILRSGDNTATGTLATIVQTSPIYVAFSVPQAVLDLLAARQAARAERDFAAADALRDAILAQGYELRDGPDGPEVYPAP